MLLWVTWMNRFVYSIKKSLIDALKELKIMPVLKIYAAIAIIICVVYGAHNTSLQVDYYEIDTLNQAVEMVLWPAIFIFLIHYLILFEVSRKTEKRKFEVMRYVKFIAMFVMVIVVYLAVSYSMYLLISPIAYKNDYSGNALYADDI